MRTSLRVQAAAVLAATALLAAPAAAHATYYPGPYGAKDVHGAIEQEYLRLHLAPGQPLTDEIVTAKPGAFNNFQYGAIYWSPQSGAREVRGAFYGYWAGQGWENGPLGFPTSSETPIAGGVYQHFEGGTLYWSSASGAHQVKGAFFGLWGSLGWERSYLGYPLTDELPAADGGVFQRFQGGTLYWSPGTGAHSVHGAFYGYWADQGWERGPLGYPTTGERSITGGVAQNFQGGTLTWTSGSVHRSKAFYANCTDVWNTIASPIYAGQQGYTRDLDRDGDGIGCEVDPR